MQQVLKHPWFRMPKRKKAKKKSQKEEAKQQPQPKHGLKPPNWKKIQHHTKSGHDYQLFNSKDNVKRVVDDDN